MVMDWTLWMDYRDSRRQRICSELIICDALGKECRNMVDAHGEVAHGTNYTLRQRTHVFEPNAFSSCGKLFVAQVDYSVWH